MGPWKLVLCSLLSDTWLDYSSQAVYGGRYKTMRAANKNNSPSRYLTIMIEVAPGEKNKRSSSSCPFRLIVKQLELAEVHRDPFSEDRCLGPH